MENFFNLTNEDLNDGKAVFKGGDSATLSIAKIKKQVVNERNKIIVECIVVDGANIGLEYSMWFDIESKGGKTGLRIFLQAFLSPEQMMSLQDPNILINRKFTCNFVSSEYNGKTYVNARDYKAVSDVPNMNVGGVQTQTLQQPAMTQQPVQPAAPQQQPVQQQATQATGFGTGMF